MIQENLDRIEALINKSSKLTEAEREELKTLSQQLKAELKQLAYTDEEEAQSVASFAKATAHEALRTSKEGDLYNLAEQGLVKSIEKYEDSHPQLFVAIHSFITKLSGIGV